MGAEVYNESCKEIGFLGVIAGNVKIFIFLFPVYQNVQYSQGSQSYNTV